MFAAFVSGTFFVNHLPGAILLSHFYTLSPISVSGTVTFTPKDTQSYKSLTFVIVIMFLV